MDVRSFVQFPPSFKMEISDPSLKDFKRMRKGGNARLVVVAWIVLGAKPRGPHGVDHSRTDSGKAESSCASFSSTITILRVSASGATRR